MSRIDYWASTSTHEYVYEKAGEYYIEGRYSHALKLYKELMNSGVDDSLYYNAALCCHKLNELKMAADYLEKSLTLNDRRFDAFVLLAEVYTSQGQYGKAIYDYVRARALKPDHAGVCLALSNLCKQYGMEFEAFYYKNKYLQFAKDKRNPEYKTINNELNAAIIEAGRYSNSGNSAFNRRDFVNAKKDYQKALKIYPADYNINLGYARLLNDLGDFDGALQYFIRALFLNNTDNRVYMHIASVYSKIRDYSRAYCFMKRYLNTLISEHNQPEYLKAIKTINSLETYAKSGNVSKIAAEDYFRLNRYFEAFLEYENLLILENALEAEIIARLQLLESMVNPEQYWSKLYLKKGQALYDSGKIREANEFFSRVMEISVPASGEYKTARSKISHV